MKVQGAHIKLRGQESIEIGKSSIEYQNGWLVIHRSGGRVLSYPSNVVESVQIVKFDELAETIRKSEKAEKDGKVPLIGGSGNWL